MTDEMKRSWLVQRLTKPRNMGRLDPHTFAFGGGYKNGGLSGEAMGLIRQVFNFDYMGAAEFEFGALPQALNRIAQASHKSERKSKLWAFTVEVPLSSVPASWRAPKDAPAPEGSASIYVLCQKAHAEEVFDRIADWARGEERLKEPTNLTNTLRPFSEWDGETVGWLELDNGFFFFTDADMWAQTCALFGLTVEVSA